MCLLQVVGTVGWNWKCLWAVLVQTSAQTGAVPAAATLWTRLQRSTCDTLHWHLFFQSLQWQILYLSAGSEVPIFVCSRWKSPWMAWCRRWLCSPTSGTLWPAWSSCWRSWRPWRTGLRSALSHAPGTVTHHITFVPPQGVETRNKKVFDWKLFAPSLPSPPPNCTLWVRYTVIAHLSRSPTEQTMLC